MMLSRPSRFRDVLSLGNGNEHPKLLQRHADLRLRDGPPRRPRRCRRRRSISQSDHIERILVLERSIDRRQLQGVTAAFVADDIDGE
jgi:hypothetical protein